MALRIDPVTLRRFRKFRERKRAWWSLVLILALYVLSLFSDFLANDKPVLIVQNGKIYSPVLHFYPEKDFGGTLDTEADYKALFADGIFKRGFVLFPPVRYGPNESDLEVTPPARPSVKHWLGTDDRGRDVLTRLIHGFRISMSFALIIVVLTILMSIVIGAVQGFYGGVVDITVQRLIEILSSLPFLYVVIIIGSVLGQSFGSLIFIFAIFNWIGMSYYIRAEYLKLRQFQFVEASRALGQSDLNIMFRHILPNALTPIITFLPFELISAIFSLSALDYLGFGLPAPTPSWGELMRQGTENLSSYWLSVFPFLAMFISLMLISFIGEGVREAFSPREHAKME